MKSLKISISSELSLPADSALFPELLILRLECEPRPIHGAIAEINSRWDIGKYFAIEDFYNTIFSDYETVLTASNKETILSSLVAGFCDDILESGYGISSECWSTLIDLALTFHKTLQACRWSSDFTDVYILGYHDVATVILGKGF